MLEVNTTSRACHGQSGPRTPFALLVPHFLTSKPLPDLHRLLHAGAEEKRIAAANTVVFKNGTARERHDEMERRAAHGLAVVVAGN